MLRMLLIERAAASVAMIDASGASSHLIDTISIILSGNIYRSVLRIAPFQDAVQTLTAPAGGQLIR
jgi:hypothetical protein